jgi:galactosyl transferase GMA12/MNN10 family
MHDTKIKFCVLVSYDEGYKRMASYTVDKNIRKYCELHGYDLHIDYQEKFSNGKPAQWQKIRAARELLDTHKYDWIFYLDTDCLIMNPNIKLESFIDDDCSFIVPKHSIEAVDTPTFEGNIISSQFFVRNDECGIDILDEIWLAQGNDKIEEFDYEGRQIRMIINDGKYGNRIKLIDEKRLNTFWYVNNPFMVFSFIGINDNVWQQGDFIVHVTGYKTEERVRILSDLNYFSGLNYKNEIP